MDNKEDLQSCSSYLKFFSTCVSFAAFMDDFASNCDDLEAFCDAVAKYDVQFDSVLLSLLDRIAQVIKSVF